jgi:hypothetical protein
MSNRIIHKVKEFELIAMYLHDSDIYKYDLMYSRLRFSNNLKPEFTDGEVVTIYLYSNYIEQCFKIKQICEYASDPLRSWFPLLPSYAALNMRLNRLGEAYKILSSNLISTFEPSDCIEDISFLDSMPIITCSGKRSGKVANEITNKGFCSTKGMYYYGLKLRALAFYRPHHLPFPEQFQHTPASEKDLNLFKHAWGEIEYHAFFGDKIYFDSLYFQDANLKLRDKAANDLFSKAVSRIRQPIESFFNWLIEKTDIQRASKVRSIKGLMVFVFGRLASAYFALIFNSKFA